MTLYEIRKITPTLLAIAAVLVLAMVLGGCGKQVPPSNQVEPPASSVQVETPAAQSSESKDDLLTKAQAESVALNHAGLTAEQVIGLHSEFDIDDGVREWDVEFRHDGWEYDYEIDAASGAIRAFDKERD